MPVTARLSRMFTRGWGHLTNELVEWFNQWMRPIGSTYVN